MATLYDAHGNLVDFKALRQELAAPSLTSVRQVISDHPTSGLTPERLARLLRASEEGDAEAYLSLAEDMEEKDLHYRAQLQTRKLACAGLPLEVVAASESKDDQDDADLVREVLAQDGVEDVLVDMLDALGKGFSVTEILWDTSGKQWRPKELVWRDPRWFPFDIADGRTPLLWDAGLPVPLAPFKFIVHQPRLKSGLPIRGGLARAAAWAWLFGNYALKDWVGFCELFGQPIRLGTYPASASDQDIDILKEAVANIGSDAAAVVPEGMQIEFKEAATKSASSDLYEKLLRYLDERVTLAVLGQTLTSGQTRGGGGSLALGQVHNQVRLDLRRADARQLGGTLTRDLAKPLVDLNRGPRKAYPKVRLQVTESEDLKALAENLSKLVPLGLRVEASKVRARFGFPDPPKGRDVELLTPPAPNVSRSGEVRSEHARGGCPSCAQARAEAPDAADLLADQLEGEAQEAMDRLLEPVRRLVTGAKTLEEIRDGLLELYPDMETAAFAELFTQAMTAGAMAGRFEVGHGR
jgi:phage gp29-like protein